MSEVEPLLLGRPTRRDLLRAGGVVGVAAFGGRALRAQPPVAEWDCIVIGAGIAGVTAARNLHRLGRRVLVLEGADRVGGRMRTRRDFVRHPDFAGDPSRCPLETGAEFVHVGDRDRYGEFLGELEALGFSTVKLPKLTRNRLAFPATWQCPPKDLAGALLADADLLRTVTLFKGVESYDDAEDVPVGRWLSRKKLYGNGLHLARYSLSSHTPGVLYDAQVDLARLGPRDRECRDTISVAGLAADRLPAQLFDETAEWKMVRLVDGAVERCGYDALPRAIADQVAEPSRIDLGRRVLRVRRVPGGVEVVSEGSDGPRTDTARTAVSTVSVGVLDPQDGPGDAIFGELLTAAKRRALRSIRMGPITKLSLEFRQSLWGKKSALSVVSNPTGSARTFFSAFPGEASGPFVITALLMGRDHEVVRELDDERAVRFLLSALHKVHRPKEAPWTPEAVLVGEGSGASFAPSFHRQDWSRDELVRGGNSFISYRDDVDTAAVRRLRTDLADPAETLPLFWAGEATAPALAERYQPLSVHGAYISGVRVATQIGRFLGGVTDPEELRLEPSAPPVIVTERAAIAAAITVPLARADADRLAAWAERYGLDADAAARELAFAGLYLHEHLPRELDLAAPGDPAAEPRVMLDPEQRGDFERAADAAGVAVEALVAALVRRALREAG